MLMGREAAEGDVVKTYFIDIARKCAILVRAGALRATPPPTEPNVVK
jgi:hypothetical protein